MARPHQRLEHEAMLDEPELRELFVEGRNLRSELTSMKSIRADRQAAKCNPASDMEEQGVDTVAEKYAGGDIALTDARESKVSRVSIVAG
ncbi:hypothetical protein GUITHDRAFT_106715 [Guillardia theta CCMP2712]|uniref:Uncharacterized protein n=1 Tax=Guillardia theta (strain CCMP2712) TaxID=905079 RepID=L1JG42_GUITC|nr:hypothetical protein GUITHDRAFT_106715 [Guillardia theta CCMP2712]EKX47267.1 hypothetical protein GUITHDRAFT_106715 [Guillardia theta CCMP2712]|eukprot:XP_005834247.1 hypothetical protein GUITHDRAFT_106715 [Guillardia theta CCMP2712]